MSTKLQIIDTDVLLGPMERARKTKKKNEKKKREREKKKKKITMEPCLESLMAVPKLCKILR